MSPPAPALKSVPAAPLAAVTDIEAAHRRHAQAVDEVRTLEGRLDAAFLRLHEARQALIERAGVSAITSFTEPVTCAFERWLGTHTARERADAPMSVRESDRAREDAALQIANAGESE